MIERPATSGFAAAPLPFWAAWVFFGLGYFALAHISHWLSAQPDGLASLWLPGGLLVAMLLRYGTWAWPWLGALAFAAHLTFALLHKQPVALALGYSMANLLEGLGGAALTRRILGGGPRLDSLRHLLVYLGSAVVLAPMLGALVGASCFGMHAGHGPELRTWLLWWGGDATGVLVTGTLLLAWLPATPPPAVGRWYWVESAAVLTLLGISAWLVVSQDATTSAAHKYLLMPFLLWSGLRLGPRGASLAGFVLTVAVSLLVVHSGSGPVFGASEQGLRLISFQSFLVVACLMGLVPAVMLAQQKNLENDLRHNEAMLAASQRVARVGHYVFQPETGHWTSSATLDEVFGITPAYPRTLAGWLELIVPEDREAMRRYLEEHVLRERKPFDREFRIRRASDQAERWVYGRGGLAAAAEGKPQSLFGVIQDITELRRAQGDFRMLFEKMIDGFALHEMVFDAQGRPVDYSFVMVNPAFEQLTGLKAAHIVGQTATAVMPGLEPFWVETYGRVVLTGQPEFFNHFSRECQRHYAVSAFRTAPGQFACVMVDETERVLAQEALKRREAELETLYNHTPLMLFLTNQQGQVERMNRTMAELTGQAATQNGPSAGELLRCVYSAGNPLGCGNGTECAACPLRAALQETYQSGTNVRGIEGSLKLQRDGKELEVHVRVATARVEIGGVAKVLVCMEDITARRQLEQMMRQAQKLEGIGQLAGGVAHDFNNILTALLMQICNLQAEPGLSATALDNLRELELEACRASDLTRRLLLFSRRSVMQVKTLDFNEVLDNLLKMLRRLIGERIIIQLRLHPAPVWIEADTTMIEQIIMNLAVNARDAMPKGGELAVSIDICDLPAGVEQENPEARPGRFARLTVRDTGTGIAAEHRKRIFEPFFTTKEEGKGTGLGLATVYGITKQHNGWIELQSEVGKGTTFEVYLPAGQPPPATDAMAVVLPQQRGAGEAILLVEDDKTVRRAMATALRRQGYTVEEAGSGYEALEIWREQKQKIALLFTDIVMPGNLDGLELAGRLREERPGLPVIISSGYNADTALPDLEASGMVFLPKPSPAPAVARAVRECLKGAAGKSGGAT